MPEERSLFPELTPAVDPARGSDSEGPPAADPGSESGPLAHRLRPETLAAFQGQKHLLAPGRPLRQAIESGTVGSIVFWGPPGCGKTTLARLIARHTESRFVTFSAVTEGVPRVRQIIAAARERRAAEGRATILFCDEIHRFNKAQQDAFLPHVEDGAITLIGATTENPSFELNAALLSRVRVFVLEPLGREDISAIVSTALDTLAAEDPGSDKHMAAVPGLTAEAIDLIAAHADGDARRALNATEALWAHLRAGNVAGPVDAAVVAAALERRVTRFDKSGEEHFNQISALHKAVRGSDVEGALYWLARMLAGGGDPMYLLRRLVRMATEDIGLTDPRALSITLAARDTYRFLGPPEGELAVAEAVIYLATAPKSNRVYSAWNAARAAAEKYPAEPVPMAVRNAPTRLMKELGYGRGYRYDHDEGGFAAGQEYLPPALAGETWYEPTDLGFEKTLGERLEWWRNLKQAARND